MDEDLYGDTDSDNLPAEDAVASGGVPEAGPGDGLPGYPVEGHAGWRAGAPGASNLLGLTQTSGEARSPRNGIDWDFIHEREAAGPPRLSMIVPTAKGVVLDHSGPTIGHGFDVGQRSVEDLRRLGLSSDVIEALTPYLGQQGAVAQAYVKAHPLTLSQPQVDAIDKAVENQTAQGLAAKFDAASHVGPFSGLPANAQTAIADVYYQYGVGDPAKATPNFWRQITNGDWQGAYDNLMDFKDDYGSRRRLEASRLQQDIKAGLLSNGTSGRDPAIP